LIEQACKTFLDFGVGTGGGGWVVIRSGGMGAFIACRSHPGKWIDPYWKTDEHVVDETGIFLMDILNWAIGSLLAPRILRIQVPETVSWADLPPASH
jgi:hypothetical protein